MVCNCGHIKVNAKTDPTRTLTLRNKFASQLSKRFMELKGLIRDSIVNRDCFGLTIEYVNPAIFNQAGPTDFQQFAFLRDPQKVQQFMDWLREQIDLKILEIVPGQQIGTAVETAWINTYIQSAYQKGMLRGRIELDNAGYAEVPQYNAQFGSLQAAFNQPFHADRVGLIYTRAFEGLKGITEEMSKQISSVLAQGIAEGHGPAKLARDINNRVDKIGRTRSRILARTEVIRAHHVATIQEYRNWGVTGVKVQAEWQTAGDSRVCSICRSLQGKIFTLDQIEGMIPRHPQCRCIALPLDITEN